MELLDRTVIGNMLGQRPKDCNKGDNGRGLLLAGCARYTGAPVLSAAAAQRSGIGLLTLLCTDDVKRAMSLLPEVMATAFGPSWSDLNLALLDGALQKATCIAAGPGMGEDPAVLGVVRRALEADKPIVLDADALNAIAKYEHSMALHHKAVITPHPGEMARLLHSPIQDVLDDPLKAAREAAKRFCCTVLLKGAASHIVSPDGRAALNATGNSGLAKGGSGDVLTGIILGLLGQGLRPYDAACAGAYLLGASADTAYGLLQERMLMARDVIGAIETTLKEFP